MITVLTTVTTALSHGNDRAAVWRDARPAPSAVGVPHRPVVGRGRPPGAGPPPGGGARAPRPPRPPRDRS